MRATYRLQFSNAICPRRKLVLTWMSLTVEEAASPFFSGKMNGVELVKTKNRTSKCWVLFLSSSVTEEYRLQ